MEVFGDLPTMADHIPNDLEEYFRKRERYVRLAQACVRRLRLERRASALLRLNRSRKLPAFIEGDFVMRYTKGRPPKTAARSAGPYQILEQVAPNVY
eukprot:scaffold4844_cov165-Pinguiococcus_pyrenoidosus.AAC.2